MGAIYKLSFPNGLSYIGQTRKSVSKRWHLHRVKSNKSWAVANAIRKYGWENVEKTVVETVSDEDLNGSEVEYIALFNTLRPNGYNLTPGGDFNPMDSEECRIRHREAVRDTEHRERQGKHSREWHADPEKHSMWRSKSTDAQRRPDVRLKHAAITKKNWKDPSVHKRRTDGLAKAFANPLTSKKRKDAATAALRRADVRAKMSSAQRAIADAPGESQRRSTQAKTTWSSRTPQQRQQHKINTKAALNTEATKKKHRDACIQAKNRLTKEQRSAALKKAWATRRACKKQ